jgi:hypothetical protein
MWALLELHEYFAGMHTFEKSNKCLNWFCSCMAFRICVFENNITGIRMHLRKNPLIFIEVGRIGNKAQGCISLHWIVILALVIIHTVWVSYLKLLDLINYASAKFHCFTVHFDSLSSLTPTYALSHTTIY